MKILLNSINKETEEALKWTKEEQRLAWFTNHFPKSQWKLHTLTEDDDRIVYCEKVLTVRMSSSVFPFVTGKKGLEFDKKKNKVKMWWGSLIQQFQNINSFLKELDYLIIPSNLEPFVTPKVLGKILSREITNNDQLVKCILKVQRYKMSAEAFLRLLSMNLYKPQITSIDKAFYNLENADVVKLHDKAMNVLAMSERLDYNDKAKYEETENALKMILALDNKKLKRYSW